MSETKLEILNAIKEHVERVEKLNQEAEYEVLLKSVKEPKLDIVQQYFDKEEE